MKIVRDSARGGRYVKIYHNFFFFIPIHDFITILVMLVLLFCKLSEQYSQTNFPIIKPLNVTKKGGGGRTANIYNNNNLLHLYSAFLGSQSALYRRGGGGISSTTSSVQHPPG